MYNRQCKRIHEAQYTTHLESTKASSNVDVRECYHIWQNQLHRVYKSLRKMYSAPHLYIVISIAHIAILSHKGACWHILGRRRAFEKNRKWRIKICSNYGAQFCFHYVLKPKQFRVVSRILFPSKYNINIRHKIIAMKTTLPFP